MQSTRGGYDVLHRLVLAGVCGLEGRVNVHLRASPSATSDGRILACSLWRVLGERRRRTCPSCGSRCRTALSAIGYRQSSPRCPNDHKSRE